MSLEAAIRARHSERRQQLAQREEQAPPASKYQELVEAAENDTDIAAIEPATETPAPNDNIERAQPTPAQEATETADIVLEDTATTEENKVETEFEFADETSETEEETTPSTARKGRPRSEKSRKAILKAVNTLLLRTSVQELSIEAIAKKAKVGKTTIYRWWPNKTAVVMDALINQPGMQTPLPTASSHAEAIEMQLDKLIRLLSSNNGQIIAQLFSEAQADEKSLKIFDENFLGPLTDAIQYSLECGKRDGEFQADLDIQMAVDMLCGPIFFRLMSHPQDLGTKFQYAYPPKVLNALKA